MNGGVIDGLMMTNGLSERGECGYWIMNVKEGDCKEIYRDNGNNFSGKLIFEIA